ncbi:MFS transporter [Nocardia sp. 2]|uniref:MFS transporter n=1 Tax=Nocardia acididurans TaxID=2802282 RepID=A0ABS1MHR0_9NOCA|nr:MFS transporter [Nocardia acididurans]MBL1080096.1 MFS transporter [Nocardia acididurans]
MIRLDGNTEFANLWRLSAFRALAGGRAALQGANTMAPIVLSLTIFELTRSVADVAVVMGARAAASVLTVLLGGVVADRLPRRLVLLGTNLGAGAVHAALTVCVLADWAGTSILALLSALNGMLATAALPAAAALVPQIVPAAVFQQANALLRLGVNIGTLGGAAAAGVIVSAAGPEWGIGLNAAVFLLAGGCFGALEHPAHSGRSGTDSTVLAGLREGWTEFASHAWAGVVVAQLFVTNAVVAGTMQVLGPPIARDAFGGAVWGLLVAVYAAGALAGGIIAVRIRPRHGLRVGVAVCLLRALPMLALAGPADLVVLVVAMFLCGIAVEQFTIAWDVALQTHIPNERLARVYSYDTLGSHAGIPLGVISAGPLAVHLGTAVTLISGAGLVLISTSLASCAPSVRRLTTRRTQRPDCHQ